MSEEIVANFELNNVELTADMELSDGVQFDTIFTINATPEKVSQLENDLNFQTKTEVDDAIEEAIKDISVDIRGSELIDVTTENKVTYITSKTFVFEQGIASNEWVIVHNLNKRPSIELVDSQGREFKAYIEYNTDNQCTVLLDSATTGYAYLN